ncbi:MAG: efflux RND transporter periplasmic adaptor subunit [Victivallales bacterium]|nr:efflux RND transporter periplasmic adaptor subunit [Victivallales bacterium]
MNKNKLLRTLAISAAALFILALIIVQSGALRSGMIPPGESPQKRDKTAGKTVRLTRSSIPVNYRSVGTVRSRNEIEISPRITARIKDISIRSGDAVKKDEILIRLDDADLQAVRNRSAEQLKAAEAALDRIAKDYKRQKGLLDKNVITSKVFEQAEETWLSAQAAMESARQALKEADANLGYALISSPMDAIISERFVDPGDMASPANILLTLFDPKLLMLYVPLRESLVNAVKIGDKIKFHVEALNQDYTGEVREIIPAIDSGSRTFMIKICILGDTTKLMPGMFGTIELELGKEHAWIVPAQAITRIGQLEYLTMVNDDNTTRKLLVKTVKTSTPGMLRIISGITGDINITIPE